MKEIPLLAMSAIMEIYISFRLYDHFFERKITRRSIVLICSAIFVVLVTCVTSLKLFYFNTVAMFALQVLYCLLCFKSKLRLAIGWSAFFTMLGVVVEIAISFAFSFVFGLQIGDMLQMTYYKAIGYFVVQATKLVLILLIIGLTPKRKSVGVDKLSLLLIALPVFAIFNEFLLIKITVNIPHNRLISLASAITGIGLICIGFSVVFLYDRSAQKKELEKELLLARQKEESNATFYREQQRGNQELRAYIHDFRNHLNNLEAAYQTAASTATTYHKQLVDALTQQCAYQLIDFNNSVLSNIIQRTQLHCAQAPQIELRLHFSCYEFGFLEPLDTSAIFDNALDNAIRACGDIPESEKPWIEIRATEASSFMMLEFRNPLGRPIMRSNGEIASTKTEEGSHGIGLKNIKAAATRYGGDTLIDAKADIFSLMVRLEKSNR